MAKRKSRSALSLAVRLALICALVPIPAGTAAQTYDVGDLLDQLQMPTENKWVSYGQGDTRAGNRSVSGGGQLMTPLWQNESSLLFSDIRGRGNDQHGVEGNFGLGYRRITSAGWIVGASGFYDLRRSNIGNAFQQATLGVEAMSVNWDARFNAYIPDGKSYNMASGLGVGPAIPTLVGNQLVLNYSGAYIERSYYGFDNEVGYLLASTANGNAELRGFVGGYDFQTNDSRFPSITGVRGRLEGRLYDLAWLFGDGSRLVAGFEYQYDRIRDSQYIGLLQVRIPLGRSQQKLTRLERRMLDSVVRDVDVVSQADTVNTNTVTSESVQVQSPIDGHWDPLGPIAQTNSSSNLSQIVQSLGSGSTVFVDGSGGPINVANPIVMNDTQRLFGGGEEIHLRGATSLEQVNYIVPGTHPTLIESSSANDVIVATNNNWIQGITIQGGNTGITSGPAATVSGYQAIDRLAILNSDISGANVGVGVGDLSNSLIQNVTSSNNVNVGFITGGLTSSTLYGNTASNQQIGFETLGPVSQNSVIEANYASGNALQGYLASGDFSGEFVRNVARENPGEGVDFFNARLTSTAIFAGNSALNNYFTGFQLGTVDGIVANNAAMGNGYFTGLSPNTSGGNGFYASTINGTVENNLSVSNALGGMQLDTISSTGIVQNNIVEFNAHDGILGSAMDGQLINNSAVGNVYSGFGFVDHVGGLVAGNLSQFNQTRGFYFNILTPSAIVRNNVSNYNQTGYETVYGNDGLVTNNVATYNSGLGMQVLQSLTGTMTKNTSSNNGADGFNILPGIANTGVFTDNSAVTNGGGGYNIGTNTGTASGNTGSGNAAGQDQYP